jgi:hypothetical protein
MKPKEKAIELYSEMLNWQPDADKYIERNIISITAKKCVLIAVNEIRRLMNRLQNYEEAIYWNEVKNEIEKL